MNTSAVPSKLPRVNVYLEEELKRKGEMLAKSRVRSLSNLLVWLLQREIAEAEASGEILTENISQVQSKSNTSEE
ncbi:MAG: ribbon-helix-helix domain-containing protein [Microcoleaceae cyanobacterium]